MADKRALKAMAAARQAAVREIERWDGIMTNADLMAAKRDLGARLASRIVAAWRRKMEKRDAG